MFVTFEGIDRSGKSTQAALLAKRLGDRALLVREPGSTPVGERVREVLIDPAVAVDPTAELLLFCAARAQLVAERIRPALEEGLTVICDRFTDSSVAYQGAGRGLGAERVQRLCDEATGGLQPGLTILVDVDPEIAATRAGSGPDRFEGEGAALQERVAAAYRQLAATHPARIVAVDGTATTDQVAASVAAIIDQRAGGPA
ncbi:MAG: dTMP kinase [Solirubrobacterales bacterium]